MIVNVHFFVWKFQYLIFFLFTRVRGYFSKGLHKTQNRILLLKSACFHVFSVMEQPVHYNIFQRVWYQLYNFSIAIFNRCDMLLLLVRSPGRMPCPNYEAEEFQPRTVDNSYPRLWVPSPYSLSPTRRSKPAFQ